MSFVWYGFFKNLIIRCNTDPLCVCDRTLFLLHLALSTTLVLRMKSDKSVF